MTLLGHHIKRIPRGSRIAVAQKLSIILKNVSQENNVDAWERLFFFARCCLRCPERGGRRKNLAKAVNEAVESERVANTGSHRLRAPNQMKSRAAQVSCKLEEGDFRGAVRLACSSDSFAPVDNHSLQRLKEKHPPAHPETSIPPFQAPEDPLEICSTKGHASVPFLLGLQGVLMACDPSI